MSKTIKIIFTLSLLLNLVLVGVSVGCFFKRGHHGSPFSGVSEETRAVFRESFEARRGEMKKDIDTIRATRTALEPIVMAETFDRAAYDAEIRKILSVREGMSERKADIFGDILEKLSKEEREAVSRNILAKLTEDRPHRGKPRDHRKD